MPGAIMKVMNRRYTLFALAAAPFLATMAQSGVPQPFKVSMLSGGQDGDIWQAGILVELEPDWKTYWRVPGDTGIPPQFDWAGSKNNGAIEVGYPVPSRFQDAGGESIGYHGQVLFPLSVKPAKPDEMVHLQLNLFFAVCKEICIPAKAKAELLLNSSASSSVLNEWQKRVPRVVAMGEAPSVTAARIEMFHDKPMLALSLTTTAQDIFVESGTTAYFGKPQFNVVSGEAWLPIWNLRDAGKLRGVPLKLTLSFGDSGIEQMLAIN
jgi:DsbC/DsbD-like thiol-disulfide interchange protein